MYSNITFIEPVNCVNLNQTVSSFCLPPVVTCQVPPKGLLTECDNVWNCLPKCGVESKYFMAFIGGDKIQIQSQFYDTDNSISNATVDYANFFDEVRFCGDITNSIDMADFASRSMVSFKDGKSYQIIEIDTSLFADEFWSLSFSKGTTTVCSQQFRRVDEDCEVTFTIKSGCSTMDCFGYCYGEPDTYIGDLIEYDNTLRFFGHLKETGFGTEIIEFGKTKKGKSSDEYLVQFHGAIPPYAKDIISKQMFDCGTVSVDGEEYEFASFTITPDKLGSMWRIAIPVFKECDKSSGGYC